MDNKRFLAGALAMGDQTLYDRSTRPDLPACKDRSLTSGSNWKNMSAGMASLSIEISELRLVVNRILDHIENDLGQAQVTLDQDDYWDVANAERYDFTKVPENFEHGQLRDDWSFCRQSSSTRIRRSPLC